MNTIFQILSYALKIRLMSTSSIAPSKKKKKKSDLLSNLLSSWFRTRSYTEAIAYSVYWSNENWVPGVTTAIKEFPVSLVKLNGLSYLIPKSSSNIFSLWFDRSAYPCVFYRLDLLKFVEMKSFIAPWNPLLLT